MALKDFQIFTKILKSNHMVKYEYDNKGQEIFSKNQDAYKSNDYLKMTIAYLSK